MSNEIKNYQNISSKIKFLWIFVQQRSPEQLLFLEPEKQNILPQIIVRVCVCMCVCVCVCLFVCVSLCVLRGIDKVRDWNPKGSPNSCVRETKESFTLKYIKHSPAVKPPKRTSHQHHQNLKSNSTIYKSS